MSSRPFLGRAGIVFAAALFAAIVAGPALAQLPDVRLPLKLTSFAVDTAATSAATSSGTVDVTIERWSTDAERDRLLEALIDKGSDKLLRTLQDIKPRAGYVHTTGTLPWDIYYARLLPGEDGGYRIVIASDRPINYWEVRNNTRSSEYEFMVCEIRMNNNGNGQGKLVTMAKVSYDQKTKSIAIENWESEPVRLNEVRELK